MLTRITIALMLGWCIALGSVAAADEPATQAEIKQARQQAAWRTRRIIWNNDGADEEPGPSGTAEGFVAARNRQVVHTQVDSVFYCTGTTFTFCHLNDVAETFLDVPDDSGSDMALGWRDNMRALKEAGTDTLNLTIEFCRRNELEVFYSMRMNDIHDSFTSWLLPQWKRDHPDYCFGNPEDLDKYDDSNPRKFWSFQNYEIPEVRERIYRIIEDVCQRYDIDGIELDWSRHPIFFAPAMDRKPVEPRQVEIMNGFVRRIRKMTDRVGRKRGRPLLVACHVPNGVDAALKIGLDVETWLENDLVDIVIGGWGYIPLAMAPQVRKMAEFVHRFNVPYYACINASQRTWSSSLEAWRGAATNIWNSGADGVSLFNLFPTKPDERLNQIGSYDTLKGLDKTYGVDRVVPDQFIGCLRPGLMAADRLPLTLTAGEAAQVKVQVGERIVANTPVGKAAWAGLRLKLLGLDSTDGVEVKFNGEPVEGIALGQPFAADGDDAWFERGLSPLLVRKGDNLVEVKLVRPQESTEPVALDGLELLVRYK
jgi:hypothetical protein